MIRNNFYIIFFGTLLLTTTFGKNAEATCEGFTGAAFGLCQAAYAVGCDDPNNQSPGCTKIETQFSNITGDTPPWSLPPCPCGTSSDFITIFNPYSVGELWCGNFISVDSESTSFFRMNYNYPWINTNRQLDISTCRVVSDSLHADLQISNDEAQSCNKEIKATAEHFGVVCKSTVPPSGF